MKSKPPTGAAADAGPRRRSFAAPGPDGRPLRLAYADWGDEDNAHVVVCVHGLTGNGRDFDALAAALADGYRVVCPDVVGRGDSDRLAEPEGYAAPTYLAHLDALWAHLGLGRVGWVGVSMGGLLGMMLAVRDEPPITRLVLDDIGPFVPAAAVARIGEYVGAAPRFDDVSALEAYLREVYAPFGPLTDAQWRALAEARARPLPDGRLALDYDPAIGQAFAAQQARDIDLWAVWDAVRCPTLVLRGAESDVLLSETAAEMAARGPRARVVELAGIGHAPALMDAEQIALVRDWLSAPAT